MKRISIILLLCSLICAFSACGTPRDTSDTSVYETSLESTVTEKSVYTPNIPDDLNYKDQTFNFLSRTEPSGDWNVLDAYTEQENGDVLNDAVYTRNRMISEKFELDITQTLSDNSRTLLKKTVLADERVYDAVLTNGEDSFGMASEGHIIDMNSLKYTDIDMPWWDTAMNSALSLYGKQYYAISDMNIMSWDATWITMVNKTVLGNLGEDINDIYGKVKAGNWIIDDYTAISKLNFEDIDGDGITDSGDRYGTVIQSQGADGFIMGCGVRYITKNDDGDITLVPLDERSSNVFDKVSAIVNENVSFNSHNKKQNDKYSENTEYSQRIFAENRAIFFNETLQCVRRLRDMEADFGVIPMPKYDENQENYILMTHWWATSMISVPKNAADFDKSSAILEYMAYLSSDMVKPAYYDIAVNGKYLRDETSIEMMDYVMQERVIDLSYILYGTEKISGDIRNLIYKGEKDYASAYAKITESLSKDLDKRLEVIKE